MFSLCNEREVGTSVRLTSDKIFMFGNIDSLVDIYCVRQTRQRTDLTIIFTHSGVRDTETLRKNAAARLRIFS
jgi:hypothetical protein